MHWYKQKYGEKHAYYHKMLNAFLFTINIQNKQDKSQYVTARTYEYLKIQLSKAKRGKPSWNSGKHGIYSDEYRKKISDNHADVSGKNNPRYGVKVSKETRYKISESNKGKHKLDKINFRGSKWMYDPITQIQK